MNSTRESQESHRLDETLEHLFLKCSFSRAIWFGSELSIRTDRLQVVLLKDWVKEWLLKPELQQQETWWFYGQFICYLWCIWLHRNDIVFKSQKPNPSRVIQHQKALFQWIYQTFQKQSQLLVCSSNNNTNQGKSRCHDSAISKQRQNPPNIFNLHPIGNGIWSLFLDIRKPCMKDWYGACAIARSSNGFCVVTCKSP